MCASMLVDLLILFVRNKGMLFPLTEGKDSNWCFQMELNRQ